MTKNENSPENLRKFLESDDPALVEKGISIVKEELEHERFTSNSFFQNLGNIEEYLVIIAKTGHKNALEIIWPSNDSVIESLENVP